MQSSQRQAPHWWADSIAKQDAEIERLRELNARLLKHDNDAEAVCNSYAAEHQMLSDEIERLRAPPTKAEVEAAARIITNLRAVDHSKEVLPFKYYRDVARVVLEAAAKVREGK